ncbi:MAG TPA: hypothetical protein VLA95_04505 [Gemmatimonadales bacterium]|nr:hypothetical protein [Gemmatimonadales bacterium]
MRTIRLVVLLAALPLAASAQQAPAATPRAQQASPAALRPMLDSLGADLAAQQASHARLMQHLHQQGLIHRDLAARVAALPDPPAGTDPGLADAVRALKRDAVRWNLQYTGLQERVREESQRFQTISNVMKTKHDTAKNSIGNVR